MMRKLLVQPLTDLAACLNQLAQAQHPFRSLVLVLVALVATWFVYVPIHELLHALGCLGTGGTVETLEVQVQYGGALLAQVFSFVEPGGEYAGRLSGFDTHGSDLVYLATDALPFSLSVLIGVPLLRACTRAARPLSMGPAIVLGLAPFYNLPGDYYEMGSILVTRALALTGSDWTGLRADDLILLIERIAQDPSALGVPVDSTAPLLAIVALGSVVALALAYATWILGDLLARALIGESPGPLAPREE